MEEEKQSRFPWPFAVGAVVVLLLAGVVYLISRSAGPSGSAAEQRLAFGPAEQAYAIHVHFIKPEMARAANFLNQEFTSVTGEISNDGVQTIRALEVTIEFHDPFNQLILRETRRLVGAGAPPLLGGQRRAFQVTFDNIPVEWDQKYPSIKVTGLIIE